MNRPNCVDTLAGCDMPPDYCFSMTESPLEFIASTEAGSGLILVCDHASNRLPPEYGTLGLDPALLSTHIASDVGAADVTRTLAARFGAPAVLARWSRLLIDLNRGEDDPTLVMKLSDGSIVRGMSKKDSSSTLILTPEQEHEIEHFQTEKVRIRKDLRAVRAGLNENIERLGTTLKILNIVVVPLVFAVIALLVWLWRRQLRRATPARTHPVAAEAHP